MSAGWHPIALRKRAIIAQKLADALARLQSSEASGELSQQSSANSVNNIAQVLRWLSVLAEPQWIADLVEMSRNEQVLVEKAVEDMPEVRRELAARALAGKAAKE